MFSLLLAVIYLAFISLGLPDSLLGSAWPVMRVQFGAPLSFAGVISMIIAGGTILSSLLSERLLHRLGTGLLTACSVAMTAVALFGFSVSNSLVSLCLWAIPYGLGAGAVDAAINNYVALHFRSRHMSWLHCFWGIGASISPYIMSACLANNGQWQMGYRTVSLLQIGLTCVLFLSLPLWRAEQAKGGGTEADEARPLGLLRTVRIPGVPYVLIAFFAYCGVESTAGLWASSFLTEARGIGAQTAASLASLFYLGITFGRFLNGFIADRLGDGRLIRIGVLVMSGSVLLILLPFSSNVPAMAGLLLFGLGCAPIYPSIIHSTPIRFGKAHSQAIIGVQMAGAYVGSTFLPPLFGWIASGVSIRLYPFFLAALVVLLLAMTELLNRRKKA